MILKNLQIEIKYVTHSKNIYSQKPDFSMYFLCINIMLNVTFNGIWSNEIYLTCIQLV